MLNVDYYYDIMHDAGRDTTEVVAEAKEALLNSVAKHFGLIDGARCSIPPVTALWLIEVDAGAADERQDLFSSCLELQPDSTQTCSVYKGSMSAHYLGAGEPLSFQNYIQQNLNRLGSKSDYEISYLGATLDTSSLGFDTAKDNLSPALNKAEAPQYQEQGRRTFTYVGGLMVAGFVAAFLGLFFVLYRRRKNFLAAQELEIALSKSDLDGMNARDNTDDSGVLRPEHLEPEIGEDGDIEQHDDEFSASNYRFDLATSMKNELFNIHGRAPDPPRSYGPNGLGIEETSDSDADSWAQTDGTIGSLELQLEPITAEV